MKTFKQYIKESTNAIEYDEEDIKSAFIAYAENNKFYDLEDYCEVEKNGKDVVITIRLDDYCEEQEYSLGKFNKMLDKIADTESFDDSMSDNVCNNIKPKSFVGRSPKMGIETIEYTYA